MIRRVAFAVIAIPLLIAIVWVGSWSLAAVLIVAAVLGTRELFDLAERVGVQPLRPLGQLLAAATPLVMILLISAPSSLWFSDQWAYVAMLTVLLVIIAAVFTRSPEQRPLASIAVTLFAPVYTAVLPSMAFIIRHAQWGGRSWTGTALVLFPLVVTWVCDSSAMFGGRLIGGPKLAPAISPGKTRAGGVAGVVGGAVIGAVFALVVFPRAGVSLGFAPVIGLAVVISVIGQIGDLAESLFKREAGVKDSSALIPGHGGVLDRLDSLYFAIPVAAAGYHLLGVI
jgi:phosphatidate cytidylyltransferase